MSHCRNCETLFDSTFCPSCGQKDVDFERPIWGLFGEIVRETLDIDGRAFRTIRTLILKPGVLTREYLAGRRRSYTPPLRLYLVISVSFFVLVSWLASRGVLLDTGQTLEKDAESQARFMSDDLPRLMLVLMPVFALFFPLEAAIAATAVVHLANNLFRVGLVGRGANLRTVALFSFPAAAMAVVGALLLTQLTDLPTIGGYSIGGVEADVTVAKLVIGLLIL